MQRMTYLEVNGAEFWGLSPEPKSYLRANSSAGGTLIIQGEIPYLATAAHERGALDALAKLAGLDVHLVANTPQPNIGQVTGHIVACMFSTVLVP